MNNEQGIAAIIEHNFDFPLTEDQRKAANTFEDFISDGNERTAMVLTGCAGTGKTSLAGAIVKTLHKLRVNVVLLAPTGRAAKVFSNNANMLASTIHRHIYREKKFTGIGGQFSLNINRFRNTLFIIDESSMISIGHGGTAIFGSGQLLDDLIKYIYDGVNCRMLLIGDKAQLPPVGESISPALNVDYLKEYALDIYNSDIEEVLRQSNKSGILWNATMIRNYLYKSNNTALPKICLKNFSDISLVQGDELIDQIYSSYSNVGIDETMIITRSNKRANRFNSGIRKTILDREDILCAGDVLMVVKNKYLNNNKTAINNIDTSGNLSFIANGDKAIVRRVYNFREVYGFHFADVTLEFPDYGEQEISTTAILDTLLSESPSLTREQNENLFENVLKTYANITRKTERMKKIREDIYYNALQIKFGYAVTCHKAQGGQWEHIYIDQGFVNPNSISEDYIHWLYRAFTRAKSHLYLINWPNTQIDNI